MIICIVGLDYKSYLLVTPGVQRRFVVLIQGSLKKNMYTVYLVIS